jgi:predicted regulator of Ras-like GTPase activity (Roadblock/LC7/MglB family)
VNDLELPLHGIVERTVGVRLAALVGLDGMVVARAGDPDAVPVDLLVATYTDLVRRMDRSAEEAGLSVTEELVLGTGAGTLVLRVLTAEYAVLALLEPGGSLGRARYELQRAGHVLRALLDA